MLLYFNTKWSFQKCVIHLLRGQIFLLAHSPGTKFATMDDNAQAIFVYGVGALHFTSKYIDMLYICIKKMKNGNKLENGKIEFIAIYPFFAIKNKNSFLWLFLKILSFSPRDFVPYKRKIIFFEAIKVLILSGKLCKLGIIKRGQNETFVFIQNLCSFPAKMAIFLATRNIFFHFYGP